MMATPKVPGAGSSSRATVRLTPPTATLPTGIRYAATTLGHLMPGQRVNLEFDIVGKYALRQRDVAARG